VVKASVLKGSNSPKQGQVWVWAGVTNGFFFGGSYDF